ncbi:hypothetical protein [Mesonia aquimarina]|uniref:hypothetical protein n=1 Tax=Mesonia aquimarina TaxID=1504967 RepID=UPI000EF6023E|nr:hypothetical protein [Mesonia aquimarina]
MNKRIFLLPALFLGLIFTSCSEDDVEDAVDQIRTIDNISVSETASIEYLPANIFEIPVETELNLRGALEDETGSDETIDQVEDIQLDDLDISLLSADDQENFDFVNSVTLGLRTDNLEYLEVASTDNIPSGSTTIDLTTTDQYLDEYAKSESLMLVIQFESTEDANNLEVELDMEFEAKINPSL